jgi:hypothetical protein
MRSRELQPADVVLILIFLLDGECPVRPSWPVGVLRRGRTEPLE